MNFSILTDRFKVLFLRRGISSMYIYHCESYGDFREHIVNNMFNLSLCLMTNYYIIISTFKYGNQKLISSSHTILFKSAIFCKDVIWLNLEI